MNFDLSVILDEPRQRSDWSVVTGDDFGVTLRAWSTADDVDPIDLSAGVLTLILTRGWRDLTHIVGTGTTSTHFEVPAAATNWPGWSWFPGGRWRWRITRVAGGLTTTIAGGILNICNPERPE
ncbi:hypothetical protein D9M68_409430 [compost metagenome]